MKRTTLCRLVGGVALGMLIGSAQAANLPTKKNFFEWSSVPTSAISKIREAAKNKELPYKFPFEYKGAFLFADRPSGVSKVEVCVAQSNLSNNLRVQVKAVGEPYVFAHSLESFNTTEYLTGFLREIFPDIALNVKENPSAEPAPICNEIEMIQWPREIY